MNDDDMTGRPRIHFTARQGWVNDPHAVTYADGRYHLFFQHNPAGPEWAPAVHWGHATSPDLHTWREEPIAFSPAEDETGCWTGALTSGPRGPVILYTSVVGGERDWSRGRIAMAEGSASLREWRRVARPVVEGPPAEGGVAAFRDPCVWRHDDGWTMVVGASIGGRGAALQYSSGDLRTWTYDGVVADAAAVEAVADGSDLPATGTMWECPQLFPLDGAWVLLVSIWADGVLHDVAAAVGDYDGTRFTARSWRRLTHGDLLYATTTFLDAAGRRCALSWLREDPAWSAHPESAGAISLPYVLAVDGDRLLASFHPGLEDVRRPAEGPLPSPHGHLAVHHDGAVTVRLAQPDRGDLLVIDLDGGRLRVHDADGRQVADAPVARTAAAGRLDVVVDGGIVELVSDTTAAMIATRCRLRSDRPLHWSVTTRAPAVSTTTRAFGVPPPDPR